MSRSPKSPLARTLAKALELPIGVNDTAVCPPFPIVKKTKELLEESFSADEINELMEFAKTPRQPKKLLDEVEIEKIKEIQEGRRSRRDDDFEGNRVRSSRSNSFSEELSDHPSRVALKRKQKCLRKNTTTSGKKIKETTPHSNQKSN